jgi:cell division transport system permease protein
MRALRYFLDEAFASLWRGYQTGLIAMATIATAFLVLGGFLVLTANMERVLGRWREAAEFSIYLRDDHTPAQRAAIEDAMRASRLVHAVDVITKEEALRRFKQNFGSLAEATDGLPENPLPASIEVRILSSAHPSQVEGLAQRAVSMPGVTDVRYDRQWIQRLMTAVAVVRAGGFILASVLVFAAALTVASVVRLALVARREEIHIMQLVGAPLAYIKGPFVVEGLIQGGVGAVLAVVGLWLAYMALRGRIGAFLAGAVEPGSLVFLSGPMCVALLAGGMAVGCIGGLIAARSTREVAD